MLHLHRRFVLFLLLDALVILGLMGIFAAVNHAFVPGQPQLSERILITPGASDEPNAPSNSQPSSPKAIAPVGKTTAVIPPTLHVARGTPENPEIMETTEGESYDLKRLRALKVKASLHKVEMGENYWSIANDNNVTINTLLGANPGMPFTAAINRPLVLLSRKGVLHRVEAGEKLEQIAGLYGVDVQVLKDENGVTWWKGIKEGDVLFVPDVKPIRMIKAWKNYFANRGFFGIPFAGWGKGWTSGFGMRTDPITGEQKLHKGMDFKAKYGESVFAAAAGKVIFAGVAGGYGNLIQIRHANGYLTYYGHLSKILVNQGHKVRRGELIGKVGATGRVTGPHLHFEIRKNGKAINPLPLI
ncbi:MAG TPA: LysM peptidoglycan-binding domain-containing M23 family metallopeptidase [bacterium]|nr:LysM peptidoglycan-binding domain-containing M23 family metallopeptidase [bacterium]